MISRINKIEKLGVFDNFNWTDDVPLMNKYCLIYGWNGVGKTTLSRVFQHFDTSSSNRISESCKFTITTKDGSSYDQSVTELPFGVRVFNKYFVEENVKWEGESKGLLHIGKEQMDVADKISLLEVEVGKLEEENIVVAKETKTRDAEYLSKVSKCGSEIKNELLKYDPTKHSYDKRNIEALLKNISEEELQVGRNEAQNESDLQKILLSERMEKIEFVAFNSNLFSNAIADANAILRQSLTSKILDNLINDTEANVWARSGLIIHRARKTTDCLFCLNKISDSRLSDLDGHFNAAYESYVKNCESVIDVFQKLKFEMNRMPSPKQFYSDFRTAYSEAESSLRSKSTEFNLCIEQIIGILNEKKRNPFASYQSIDINSFSQLLSEMQAVSESIEKYILENNDRTSRLVEVKTEKLKTLELVLFVKKYEVLKKLESEKLNIEKRHSAIEAKLKEKKSEIISLRGQLDIGVAADDINKNLAIFLGRDEIRLIVKERAGYQITRNGELAVGLSEGERTAIAFVYFISKLKERDFDRQNGVVFIDDPVSSFDENSIYSACAFVRNQLKDCKQLIISTHNFSFFKLIRSWLGQKPDDLKAKREGVDPRKTLMFISSYKINGSRVAALERLDRLLAKNDSEYEFLFKKMNQLKVAGDLEHFYPLANICRKFLEIFLSFKYPRSDDLKSKLDAVAKNCEFDEQLKEDIFSFINRYSHSDSSYATAIDLTGLVKGPRVVEDIFALIKKSDDFHYSQLQNGLTN